jgi:hypothetical protein
MLAVAAILSAGGTLWREVSEWVEQQMDLEEATLLSNPQLLERVWEVVYAELSPYGVAVSNRPAIPNA